LKHNSIFLTDDEGLVGGEVVCRNLEVQRRRAFANTAGDVVVRTVARAEPATVVTGLTDGDTTEVGADTWIDRPSKLQCQGLKSDQKHTKHDEPLGPLYTILVGLRISESLPVVIVGLLDLISGAVADEDGLATPFDDDLFVTS
jgi:hypothetical protein